MAIRQCIGDEDGVCDRSATKRDRCEKHYQRWLKKTPPAERSPRLGLTDLDRFYSFVNKMGPVAKNRPDLGRCHLWTGGNVRGYGKFWAEGATHQAHVWIYKKLVGPIPPDRELDHFACDRVGCVNERHVRPETHSVNVLRSGNAPALNAAKTKCPENHSYDESNTRINEVGARECKTCKRKHQRQIRQAERAIKRAGYIPLAPGSTTCPAKHDLTAKDASYTYHGQLVCLICTAPKGKGGRPVQVAA